MLDIVELDLDNVWKILKGTRKTFVSKLTDADCQHMNTYVSLLLSEKNIKQNIDDVEKKLGINVSFAMNKNVSGKVLKTAVKMFTYLSFCPPKYLILVSNILKMEPPKNIILALTSMKMTTHNLEKLATVQILAKVMESLGLKQFEEIQIISKRICHNKNGTFGNCASQRVVDNPKVLGFFLS